MPGGAPKTHEVSDEGSRTSLIRQDRDVGCIHPLLRLSESQEFVFSNGEGDVADRANDSFSQL
jgi:hypothetical protein